eukprot:3300550-Pyramimonas_sp.AAC.1
MLQGTQFRAHRQAPVQFLHAQQHVFWHAGHGEGSNRACGVAIGFHKRTFTKGVSRGRQDMAIFSLYFPPRVRGKGAVQRQREVCQAVGAWVQQQMDSLPAGCIPVLGIDHNSTCGKPQGLRPVCGEEDPEADGQNLCVCVCVFDQCLEFMI